LDEITENNSIDQRITHVDAGDMKAGTSKGGENASTKDHFLGPLLASVLAYSTWRQ
jgi:hypothetical protein